MKKVDDRHTAILNIIKAKNIYSQDELCDELINLGHKCSQGTISRDMQDLHIIKVKLTFPKDACRYIVSHDVDDNYINNAVFLSAKNIADIVRFNNFVAIYTFPGYSSAVIEAVKFFTWPENVGILAGDNIILLLTRNEDEAALISDRLQVLRE